MTKKKRKVDRSMYEFETDMGVVATRNGKRFFRTPVTLETNESTGRVTRHYFEVKHPRVLKQLRRMLRTDTKWTVYRKIQAKGM